MRNIYLVLLLLVFVSCSEVEKKEPDTCLVPVDSLSVEIGSPTLIKIAENHLFVNHSFTDGYDIDVIDVKNDSIMYSFVSKGQGANEFLQITSLDVFKEDSAWYVSLYDNFQRKLVVYSIDSLDYYKGGCLPAYTKSLLADDTRLLELYKIKNGYIATGRTEKKYTFLDDKLKPVKQSGDYLISGERHDDYMLLSKANYGRIYRSLDEKSLASVVFMSGKLSVYDIGEYTLNEKWSYTSSGFEYEVRDKVLNQISPTGYLAADFVQDNVIGLYSGEIKINGTNYGNEFHCFDSQGKLLKRYALSSKLYNFCISPSSGFIYAISYQSDPKILVFRMN